MTIIKHYFKSDKHYEYILLNINLIYRMCAKQAFWSTSKLYYTLAVSSIDSNFTYSLPCDLFLKFVLNIRSDNLLIVKYPHFIGTF
ncbi:hypothetical protein PNEG_04291 [Pneumocystis murina B123]|uniref:Uncharacterized protein n=1 Tax=Pneumocystis murina (strain B123) TaxID=1069680 RepID=A0A0W4ZX06_PNEMU|nr:hypothetical protein PNEG_04291 [Pneumocystis murina B123]KTW32904.1 hypothetical protein PNEG_04291 [Pneumocystis murina B123]